MIWKGFNIGMICNDIGRIRMIWNGFDIGTVLICLNDIPMLIIFLDDALRFIIILMWGRFLNLIIKKVWGFLII